MKRNASQRILMINDHIHFGGGGDVAFRMERHAYEQAGYDVFTFSCAEDRPHTASERDFIAIESGSNTIRKAGKFLASPTVTRKLIDALEAIKPNMVSAHLISKYPLSIYPQLDKFPVVQTLHGPNLFCASSWGNLKSGGRCEMGIGAKCFSRGCVSMPGALLYTSLYRRLARSVRRNVDLFVCPSVHLRESAISLGFTPAEFFPLGIDSQFEGEPKFSREAPPLVLYVGALVEQKGVHILIDAFKLVLDSVPSARLLIAGRGVMSGPLARQVQAAGLEDSVEFLGFVDHEKIADLYREANVLVIPSIWKEQFGLIGPEALACGTPAVGSAIGGIPEWLRDGEWGFTVPPRDRLAMADRIVTLLKNPVLRQEFGAKGRAWALENYSAAKYCNYRLELLKKYSVPD